MKESIEKIDKYRILKRLGEGGFGVVYLAHDDRVDRDVAIKVFQPRDENLIAFATSSSEDGLQVLRQRFVREARILGRLSNSPYIINIYEFGETEEGSPYYVMPYVASHLGQLLGRDVFDRAGLDELDQSAHPRALSLEQCLTLLHQILQGMKAAHGHGLVHRDIKPSNILLSDTGQVRIADFGIAKEPDTSATKSQVGMGSRNYMAPEQQESAKHVDRRADVYSLGVLAYRMLTGKLPTGRYADPEVRVPQLGRALNGLILKALSEDRDKRFTDAGEMLTAYEAARNQRAREDEAENLTDCSSDTPVSGVPERLRPLYELIDSTLLEYGDVEPKLGQLQGMAAVAGLDNEALQYAIQDRIQGDKKLQRIVKLHELIQKKIAASTDAVKDLVTELLPAAELAGKDRAWLKARVQVAAAEQDSSRPSPQAASHRTSKHVAASSDARSGNKQRLPPIAVTVVAVVAVSVIGLWFWSEGLDDAGRPTPTRSVRTTTFPSPAGVSQSPSTGSGDRTNAVVSRSEQTGLTLAELTAGNSIFEVTTNEPGVTVLLDGVELGRTPLSRDDLRPGRYTLSLQSPYYEDREVAVTLADGMVFKEDYVLQTSTGQLTVLSEPAGAAVYIDGQDIGEVTPVTLNDVVAGARDLSLRLAGYQTTEAQTVTVEEEQTAQVSETLRKTWRLTVNATPSDAVIHLPVISSAYRPGMDLLPGEYRVEVSAPHHVSQTRTVYLVDSDKVIEFALKPLLPVLITSNVTDLTDVRITLSGKGNDYTYHNDLQLPAGSYQVSATAEGYAPLSETWQVSENNRWLVLELEIDADFDAGLAAYRQGNYATALQEFLPLAEQGYAPAQTNLGVMYQNGRGVSQDYRQAVEWYRKAAEQGYAQAQTNLGFMYEKGRGVAQGDRQALEWYRKAAEQGYARAQTNLGFMYENGRRVAQDDRQAVEWYRKAAEQGYARAQTDLGVMYRDGRGVSQDDRQAVEWYRKAAEQGYAIAQNNLGFMYRAGRGVAQDDRQAVEWYRKAAEQGHAIAQNNLGFMYQSDRGVAQDGRQAVEWFRKAAEQGHAGAQNNLGFMYQNGRGVSQDDRQAVEWYRKAAEQGDAIAQTNLGFMYENGRGVAQDYRQAVEWYRKAAEQGHAIAQNNLGFMYQSGRGVTQDYRQAVEWFRKAAEQGHAIAQNNLGFMYQNGRGVSRDYRQAVEWYRKAAEQGHTLARERISALDVMF